MTAFLRFFTLLTLTAVASCVTEFQPDTIHIEPALIVEGQIFDRPGPYIVQLTRTADYSIRSINLLETGATVTLEDNLGTREVLTDPGSYGIYQTRIGGIRGVAGRSYKLTIQTRSGQRYESAWERLSPAPAIDSLYAVYRNEPASGTAGRNQRWDVYLDTKDPDTLGNFYRWEWAHYEPVAVCQKTELPNGTLTGLYCCTDCWDIDRCPNCIDISSDVNINGRSVSGQRITEVPYTSRGSYYLEVQQQALSRGAYQYWKSVRQLVTNTGGPFDAAPSSIRGNVRCVSDSSRVAYGYFGATGLTERYLYVDRSAGQGLPPQQPTVNVPVPSACVVCAITATRTPIKPRWWVQ